MDELSCGPIGREKLNEDILLMTPISKDSNEIATQAAAVLLNEQIEEAKNSPNSVYGNKTASLAHRTSSNFVISIIRSGLVKAKEKLGNEFGTAWRDFKSGAYNTMGGTAVVGGGGLVISFILGHYGELTAFVSAAISNPAVSQILQFLSKVFGA